MTQALVVRLTGIARVLRAVLGAPDYERYVEHVSLAHPDIKPMSCEQFMKDRMNDRYSRPGSRCC
ncbi:MAG TPA: YbdD/YjiX family protein [Gemmatimonadaceae bacterium]|nr:YbdD/YjiX family protein [Gemmatimonadaceae bacterium]